MTQLGVAALIGVPRSGASNLLQKRIDKFTVDIVVNWLSRLRRRVEVVLGGDPSLRSG